MRLPEEVSVLAALVGAVMVVATCIAVPVAVTGYFDCQMEVVKAQKEVALEKLRVDAYAKAKAEYEANHGN